jgi:D-3-phosphoglycerate dehydrogenase / 2-oxoglutarate reductase
MSLRCLISTSSFGKQAPASIERLEAAGFELRLNPYGRKLRKKETLELYLDADVVIAGVEDIDREVFANSPNLKVISRCGIGVDSVDLEEARRRDIPVLVTPEPPALAVSELTVGLIFALARHICTASAAIHDGQWKPLLGVQISGKTLGIIGLGRVGRKVARIMACAGMELYAHDPMLTRTSASQLNVTLCTLDALLADADFVSLHVPLLPETKRLMNANRLRQMKRGSFLINTARGGLIDEGALVENLKSCHLAGAALDVFEQEPYEGPLREVPNVIMTAHMGSYAAEARIAMEGQAVENLIQECRRLGLIEVA